LLEKILYTGDVKREVLLITNCFLAITFFCIFISGIHTATFNSLYAFFKLYAGGVFLLGLSITNGITAYKLFVKKQKPQELRILMLITFLPLMWFLMFFIGYFFAANPLLPAVVILFAGALFYFTKPLSQKIAIIITCITILVYIITIVSSFEEDYCWKKGDRLHPNPGEMVTATKDDEKRLQTFNIKAGNKIGSSFREHMLCHQTYDFPQALKETYLGGR
jgi:hypothetical protein